MKYISIGCQCSVKYQIDKHKGITETLFFDWLMTSMNSVIKILSCDNINDILYFDNIIKDINIPYHGNNTRIVIKSLDFCVSLHDLPKNYTNDDIINFINKYKRRFNRIIEIIKSNEKIYFIRDDESDFDDNIRNKFIETILKINPNCNFTIVVINNNKTNDNGIFKYKNCLYFKLNINPTISIDWTKTYLNWEKIFLDIEKNT